MMKATGGSITEAKSEMIAGEARISAPSHCGNIFCASMGMRRRRRPGLGSSGEEWEHLSPLVTAEAKRRLKDPQRHNPLRLVADLRIIHTMPGRLVGRSAAPSSRLSGALNASVKVVVIPATAGIWLRKEEPSVGVGSHQAYPRRSSSPADHFERTQRRVQLDAWIRLA